VLLTDLLADWLPDQPSTWSDIGLVIITKLQSPQLIKSKLLMTCEKSKYAFHQCVVNHHGGY